MSFCKQGICRYNNNYFLKTLLCSNSTAVDLRSRSILEAIISMCPNLEVVWFDEMHYSEGITPDVLISLLPNHFKKVKRDLLII